MDTGREKKVEGNLAASCSYANRLYRRCNEYRIRLTCRECESYEWKIMACYGGKTLTVRTTSPWRPGPDSCLPQNSADFFLIGCRSSNGRIVSGFLRAS